MPTEFQAIDQPAGAAVVDPWHLLTGASVVIVIGFAVDLLRLGLHSARQAFAAHKIAAQSPPSAGHWPCSNGCG